MHTFVRAVDQDQHEYDLDDDGVISTIPQVGDEIHKADRVLIVKRRVLSFEKPGEVQITLYATKV